MFENQGLTVVYHLATALYLDSKKTCLFLDYSKQSTAVNGKIFLKSVNENE